MELKEAKKYAEDVQIHLLQHTSATDYPPTKKDDALICLANRITELEAEMKQILNEFDEVEAQRDELVIVCKAALERCPFPVGAMAVKERLQNIARKHR